MVMISSNVKQAYQKTSKKPIKSTMVMSKGEKVAMTKRMKKNMGVK